MVTGPETPRAYCNLFRGFYLPKKPVRVMRIIRIDSNKVIKMFTAWRYIYDPDVFGRNPLMSRLIYIRDNETDEGWNINHEWVCNDYESYSCVHSRGYTIIVIFPTFWEIDDNIEGSTACNTAFAKMEQLIRVRVYG